MLIVVEDRNVTDLFQFLFDFETFRCLDIFEVDASERIRDGCDGFDDLFRLFDIELDIDGVDVGERFEKNGFSFHDRLAGEMADVAEAENRRTVADDGDEIAFVGVVVRRVDIFFDFKARKGYTRAVSHCQLFFRVTRFGDKCSDFTVRIEFVACSVILQ